MSNVGETLVQRTNRYGSMEDNALLTQTLMGTVMASARDRGHVLTPMHKECLHMIMHKVARMVCGDPLYADNPHDIAGYATLLEKYINEINAEGE